MTDAQSWALLVGVFVPIVTALVIRQGWSQPEQAVANFFVAAVAAVGTEYFKGDLDPAGHPHGLISVFLIVMVASVATYHGFWSPTKVAPKVEAATGGDPA